MSKRIENIPLPQMVPADIADAVEALDGVKAHVAECPRCRTASHIGALCRVGRRWVDGNLRSWLAMTRQAKLNRTLNSMRVR